jgi:hypothetical protein
LFDSCYNVGRWSRASAFCIELTDCRLSERRSVHRTRIGSESGKVAGGLIDFARRTQLSETYCRRLEHILQMERGGKASEPALGKAFPSPLPGSVIRISDYGIPVSIEHAGADSSRRRGAPCFTR